MRRQGTGATRTAKTGIVMTLLRSGERFDAVIRRTPIGTHELRYLWNGRPFISQVFQRGTAQALMESARKLKDELLGRGWLLAPNQ
jgi:hypothetical protein